MSDDTESDESDLPWLYQLDEIGLRACLSSALFALHLIAEAPRDDPQHLAHYALTKLYDWPPCPNTDALRALKP